ncbi:MAG: hypothetical protein Q9200_004922 [Gallowayella weberi]
MAPRRNDRFSQPYTLPYTFMALCGSGFALAKYAERYSPRLIHLIHDHFICSPRNLHFRRYHTLLTSSFMHVSPLHLAVNMITLFNIGPLVVSTLGPNSFLTLWVGGALGCSRASLSYAHYLDRRMSASYAKNQNLYDSFLKTQGRSVGASGSILGMFTPYGLTQPHGNWYFFPIPFPLQNNQMVEVAAAGSAACLALGLLPTIGHAGHLGGMAVGAAYAYYALNWRPRAIWKR